MPSLFPADPPGHHADALPADTGHAVTRGLHRLLRTRHAFWKLFVPLVLLMLGTGLFSLQQLHLATQSRFYSLQQLAVDNREAQLQEAFDAYLNLLRGINQDVALRRYATSRPPAPRAASRPRNRSTAPSRPRRS